MGPQEIQATRQKGLFSVPADRSQGGAKEVSLSPNPSLNPRSRACLDGASKPVGPRRPQRAL